jgi:uncharacterized coiled-coil DUF342 family protein
MALIDQAQDLVDDAEEAKDIASQIHDRLSELAGSGEGLYDKLETVFQEADAIMGYIEERDKESRIDSAATAARLRRER